MIEFAILVTENEKIQFVVERCPMSYPFLNTVIYISTTFSF